MEISNILVYIYEHEATQKPISENIIGAPLVPQKQYQQQLVNITLHLLLLLLALPLFIACCVLISYIFAL